MRDADIILGVTGGISAYKSAALASQLAQDGFEVQVVMTRAALKFIGQPTFSALTGRDVCTRMFDRRFPLGPHIEIARQAKLMCVAPATADFMYRAAHGAGDDLLAALYLCFTGPVLFAPAMNCEMWEKPSVQRNIATLTNDGVQMVGPDEGWLSCRDKGIGRMSQPEEIVTTIKQLIEKS